MNRLELDGNSLTAAQVVAASRGPVEVVVATEVRERVERAWLPTPRASTASDFA